MTCGSATTSRCSRTSSATRTCRATMFLRPFCLRLSAQGSSVVSRFGTRSTTSSRALAGGRACVRSPLKRHIVGTACRRAFNKEEPLLLPHSFAEFTLCDVLVAMFPDFDASVESSAAAGGTVRVDRVRQWDTSARTLLVVAHYIGEDADAEFVCGGCRVNARLAALERSGTAHTLVARGTVPGWDRSSARLRVRSGHA